MAFRIKQSNISRFTQKVYHIVSRIPKGKVLSYAEVAQRAGSFQAYRAVGNTMHRNPDWPRIPCHRVVQSNGCVGNWSGKGGVKKKIALLRSEGILIRNEKIVDI